MREWLEAARARIAAESGVDPGALSVSEGEIEALLDLARAAAHGSGDRTNAPLVAYLVGVAMGRNPGLDLAELAREAAAERP
ncbi:MAG TPA: DUF6457 domain-containing protein [Gaiellaceae bacterium]|nr:DUF6457 domain-containing protein [Gaiellaceae bacterium]